MLKIEKHKKLIIRDFSSSFIIFYCDVDDFTMVTQNTEEEIEYHFSKKETESKTARKLTFHSKFYVFFF